jgi:DNA replication and repair protein RecF
MRVASVSLRDFRNYERAELGLGERLTVVHGPNGAGKTNLLEAVYFACTGRSCRTSNDRELVRHTASVTRVTADVEAEDGAHRLEVGFQPGEPKRMRIDGASVERLAGSGARPLVSVFLPDRLELVKGAPALRRAHLDQFLAAVWPAWVSTKSSYARALAQRNALISRVRAGTAAPSLLDPWDAELARYGIAVMADRTEAAEQIAPRFAQRAAELGLPEPAELRYRPRSKASDEDELRAELLERRADDLRRGFSAHGPHRDDLVLSHDGRSLRSYGSQGQQRVALLALLFAERDVLVERGRPPLMLLDDVMSELDAARRERLAALVRDGGQAVITATEVDHVPGADEPGVTVASVAAGTVMTASETLA